MIDVFEDYEAMSQAAAALFSRSARQAVRTRGRFAVALAGGSTPARTYELLSREPYRERIPWGDVHIFWGDERCVPADDPRSNQRMARRALLDSVPIPPAQIHPIDGTLAPDIAALEYDSDLRVLAQEKTGFLDLVLLGLGEDGHTASLFPGTSALDASNRWVLPVAPTPNRLARITLTPQFINHARQIVFLVSGSGKVDVLRRVLEGQSDDDDLPARSIQPTSGELRWMIDRKAAAGLAGRLRRYV